MTYFLGIIAVLLSTQINASILQHDCLKSKNCSDQLKSWLNWKAHKYLIYMTEGNYKKRMLDETKSKFKEFIKKGKLKHFGLYKNHVLQCYKEWFKLKYIDKNYQDAHEKKRDFNFGLRQLITGDMFRGKHDRERIKAKRETKELINAEWRRYHWILQNQFLSARGVDYIDGSPYAYRKNPISF